MSKVKIFVDLDDTLVDFTSPALNLLGTSMPEFLSKPPPTSYGNTYTLGFPQERFFEVLNNLSVEFWATLELKPFAREFYNFLTTQGDTYICTSPPKGIAGVAGKMLWLENFLPYGMENKFVFIREKHELAAPNRLLIDDSDKQIAAWRKAGGVAVQVPTHSNVLHTSAHVGLQWVQREVEEALRRMKGELA
jgi:5'(3')-deoxyribonucleotidase